MRLLEVGVDIKSDCSSPEGAKVGNRREEARADGGE